MKPCPNILSLFTALPRSLYIETVNNKMYYSQIKTRQESRNIKCNDFYKSLKVGMKVQCKALPKKFIYRKAMKATANKRRKTIKYGYKRRKLL